MDYKTFEEAKRLENEIASLEVEQESYKQILHRIDAGLCSITIGHLTTKIEPGLLDAIYDFYQKKLEDRIAKIDQLKKEFEEL